MKWTIDQDDLLTHWKGRYPATQIAKKLEDEFGIHFSRNMVIGRLDRLRKANEPKMPAFNYIVKTVSSKPLPEMPEITCSVDFMDLRAGSCRFPDNVEGAWKFCGEPIYKKSYCKSCYRVCYKQEQRIAG